MNIQKKWEKGEKKKEENKKTWWKWKVKINVWIENLKKNVRKENWNWGDKKKAEQKRVKKGERKCKNIKNKDRLNKLKTKKKRQKVLLL